MTKLITAIHIERFGVYKLVEYDGPRMWEAIIGDPYMKIEDILSKFDEAPSQQFEQGLRQILDLGRREGTTIASKIQECKVTCPCGARECPYSDPDCPQGVNNVIIHLNDNLRWTREQIADWLDTLESQPVFYPAEGVRNFNTTRMVTYKSPLSKDDAKASS